MSVSDAEARRLIGYFRDYLVEDGGERQAAGGRAVRRGRALEAYCREG